MWPWEHLVFGYLVYWPVGRAQGETGLGDRPVLALAVASQFPDLVDKPLAWGLHVLPSGLSVAHSLLFAVPLSIAIAWLARLAGDRPTGVAFGVGYGSHLLGDVLYNTLLGGRLAWTFLVWPLVERPVVREPFGDILLSLLTKFAGFLTTPSGLAYVGIEAAVVVLTLLRWRLDGYPGLGYLRRARAKLG